MNIFIGISTLKVEKLVPESLSMMLHGQSESRMKMGISQKFRNVTSTPRFIHTIIECLVKEFFPSKSICLFLVMFHTASYQSQLPITSTIVNKNAILQCHLKSSKTLFHPEKVAV